jgi:hypothetical protein
LLQLSEAGGNLVISYPAWTGLLAISLGIALGIHLVRHFTLQGKAFGMAAATALLVVGGLYFLTYKVTLTPDEGRVYALTGGTQRIEWSHATSVATEERRGRGTSTWLVIRTGAGGRLEFRVTGLSGTEEHRLMEYVTARMKK